jgi:hypothetical protein
MMMARKIIRTVTIPPAWLELADHDSPFLYFYTQRRQKEQGIWENK